MDIRYASLTDVGVKRSHNQDACASRPAADDSHWKSHGHVFIVADGMGGHAVGEKASARAASDIPLTFLKHVEAEGVPAAIKRAFEEANESIHQIGVNNPEFKGLGTTGTALILRPEGAWVGHVGDSRAYRVRGDRVQQLTFDHSWVWEVARRQGIDPDELGDFKRNVIIRSLGPDTAVEVDIEGPHPLEPGDVFIVCSDGLTNEVATDEIGAVAKAFPPDVASRYLVDLANVRGGRDNVTCLMVEVPPDATGLLPGRRGLRLKNPLAAVPWPFLALGAGTAIAAGSVALQLSELKSLAVPAFLLAAGLIAAGLVGFYLYLANRRKAEDGTDTAPAVKVPGELHVYRDHAFEYGPALVGRFTEFEGALREVVSSSPEVEVDWPKFQELSKRATELTGKAEYKAAFAARFEAVQTLARALHELRGKGEGFQPSYSR